MRGQNGAAGQGADLARNRTDYQTGALSRDGQGGQPGQQGQPGQAGQQGQPGQQGQAGQPGQPGQQGQAGQQGGRGQQGQGGGQGPQGGQNAQGQNGGRGSQGGQGGRIGDIAPGGGRVDGQAVDQFTFDTGNNGRAQGKAASPQATPAIDNQQSIQQGVNELNQLRQQASADPEVQRQIQQLIGEMEHLDLKRFPGNPAMVEELHQRLLSGLDTLELQLRRDLDGKKTGQIRGADPIAVPLGYKDAVADYFRRLSTTTTSGAGGEK